MRNQRRVRLAAVGAALALAAVAVGCGGRNDTSNNAATGSGVSSQVQAGPGFDGKEITLGVLTPLTGSASIIGKPLTAGNELYFKALNAKGGIAGKYPVKLITNDTKYDPSTAIQLYNQMKSNVVMFSQILGTPIVDPLKQQLAADGILGQPATQDAFWVKEPNLMPIGAPYQIQVINGLQYAVDKLDAKSKKVCILYKDDPYGQAAKAGYDFALGKLGLKSTAEASYKATETDYTAAISQLSSPGCQIVVGGILASELNGILTKAAGANFNATWLGTSPSWLSIFAKSGIGPYAEKNFLLVAEGPNWGDETVPGMKEQMDAVKQFAPDTVPDGYFTFGYNEAKGVAQVLEEAVKNGDLSPKGVVDASHKIAKLTFGGVYGDFKYGNPADREPPRANTIFKIDGTKPNATDAIVKVESEAAKAYTFKE